jgi:hypothetical protein
MLGKDVPSRETNIAARMIPRSINAACIYFYSLEKNNAMQPMEASQRRTVIGRCIFAAVLSASAEHCATVQGGILLLAYRC